jgi:hypothetical protein
VSAELQLASVVATLLWSIVFTIVALVKFEKVEY